MTKKEIIRYLAGELKYLNERIEEGDHTHYTTSLFNWLLWVIRQIRKNDIDWIFNYDPWQESTGLERGIIWALHRYAKAQKKKK